MSGATAINLREVWDEALAVIRSRVSRQSFEAWFRPLTPGAIEQNRVQVLLPNRFFKEWFEEHYLGLLRSALEDLTFSKVEIVLLLPDKDVLTARPAADEPGERRAPRRSRDNGAQLNPRYTFDSFVVGTSNQFAHAACMAVADQLAKTYNPLFIYGGVGLGKTHLLHAIGHHARQRDPRVRVSYVSSEKFTNDLINAIRFDATVEFRNRYRGLDLLLVDDIQFIAGKERTQEEFFHTFNDLYDSSKQIVISSDRVPREIPTLEERLRSRFEWGLIADIQPPDLETKAAILRKKAQAQGVRLPDEVSLFIAKHVKSSIRELEGSLVRLAAQASFAHQEINLELAQEVLRELTAEQQRLPTISSIQKAVAEFFSVRVEDLRSRGRNKSIVLPRQVAMYLCREIVKASLPDIGDGFGGKDHSTVIHACEKVKRKIAGEDAFRRQVEELTVRLSP
ncbi:MAG TPA: chromosomal replication initiator protein DnaA [Candidatus Baltobacteraceae bacterium]|nr:chromosomal replication initiator protein DnaA [Candidatus Baltobacteraceae bacterium]